MSTQAPPLTGEDPMVLFQGKRAAERVRVELPVECAAATGAPVATTSVDLSTTGALLRLVDPRSLGLDAQAGLPELAARIAMRFPGSMRLRFTGAPEDLRGRVVRVVSRPPPEMGILVGVRFERALTPVEATRLGLPAGPEPGARPATPAASAAPTAGTPIAAAPKPPTAPVEAPLRVERDEPRRRVAPVATTGSAIPPAVAAPAAPTPLDAPARCELTTPAPMAPVPSVAHPSPAPLPHPGPVLPSMRASQSPPLPAPGALPATVHVYLFPALAAAPTARVRARNLWGEGLELSVEVPLSPEEKDPMAVGAFLGEHARLVVVHEGQLRYDGPVRVTRILSDAPSDLRLLLKAERPLPEELAPSRRGPQPADVRVRQVTRY